MMPPNEPNTRADAIALLADFIESDGLERLEAWSGRFNVFEALGAVRSELRHSNMLAWLLDPSGSHDLGTAFLDLFLRHASRRAREDEGVVGDAIPTPFDVDGWDLSGAEVRREWRNVDLLVLDRANGFVCAVENKVFSGEHPNQLERYRTLVGAAFPDVHHQLFLFLSPGGVAPSDPHYAPLSYDDVGGLLDRLLARRGTGLGAEVRSFVSHYKAMIDRHLSDDPEIERICRDIYRAHRHALDLIYAHLPDLYAETHEQLVEIIDADPELVLDKSNKTYTRFMPVALDRYVPRQEGGSFDEGRVVVFEFENREGRPLHLKLEMTPADAAIRRPILDYVHDHPALFGPTSTKDTRWKKLWGVDLADPAVRGTDPDERRAALKDALDDFKRTRLPQFVDAFAKIHEAFAEIHERPDPDNHPTRGEPDA